MSRKYSTTTIRNDTEYDIALNDNISSIRDRIGELEDRVTKLEKKEILCSVRPSIAAS